MTDYVTYKDIGFEVIAVDSRGAKLIFDPKSGKYFPFLWRTDYEHECGGYVVELPNNGWTQEFIDAVTLDHTKRTCYAMARQLMRELQ